MYSSSKVALKFALTQFIKIIFYHMTFQNNILLSLVQTQNEITYKKKFSLKFEKNENLKKAFKF